MVCDHGNVYLSSYVSSQRLNALQYLWNSKSQQQTAMPRINHWASTFSSGFVCYADLVNIFKITLSHFSRCDRIPRDRQQKTKISLGQIICKSKWERAIQHSNSISINLDRNLVGKLYWVISTSSETTENPAYVTNFDTFQNDRSANAYLSPVHSTGPFSLVSTTLTF